MYFPVLYYLCKLTFCTVKLHVAWEHSTYFSFCFGIPAAVSHGILSGEREMLTTCHSAVYMWEALDVVSVHRALISFRRTVSCDRRHRGTGECTVTPEPRGIEVIKHDHELERRWQHCG